jgi:sugar O-acyltransferase (sialic acid O-acetyltransferase NeuD family)
MKINEKRKSCIIFGSNTVAEVVAYLLEADSEYSVAGFCVSKEYRDSDEFYGRPLVDFETVENDFPQSSYEMFVVASYANNNRMRERFYREAKNKGYKLLTYISSKSTFMAKSIGDNTFIFEDNTVQPFVEIGNNVILWSGNHIGHHSVIEDNVFVSSHVVISGLCRIGRNSFLGVNSTIRDGVKLGGYNTLGAAALIVKDTPEGCVYVGAMASKWPLDADN